MPPALAKAPIFQPPKCLVKSRPSSQTPSSPSHSHRMTQNRLKLTKPYTSVPLPLGQSVIFPWWTIVWRKQLLAIEWHMWDEKSLVKTWHLATTHQPNQDVSNHVQRGKTLLILMVSPGVRWRGGFVKLWHPKWRACHENCISSYANVAKVLRLPHKTTFGTLQNTSECHEVQRLPCETKQRDVWNVQKRPLLQNLPYTIRILLRIRGEVSHPACCSTIPWDFEKPYKKSRFWGVLALTKSIGF